ncbi:chemotaxis protein CheW [Modestobacter sp. NPDC049651]|uniref:chemotaxis protein CheW n=1 Tax=unclassified Modestobacter TaxID=2643866 RepID=UPI00340968C4
MGDGPEVVPAADVYGVVRLAGVDVGLPLSVLREVVPCPAELSGLPAAAPGLLGAMDLRTTVLPVVDLRAVLGRETGRRPDQVVVVIAWEGQALGLLADEVCGVTRVPGPALLPVRAQRGELLFSHTFLHPETGRATSVLDPAAVLGLPGVPTVADVTRSTAAVVAGGGPAGRRAGGRTVTRVRCGPHLLAVDVRHVHTTLPTPATRPTPLRSALVAGATEFAGREVGVVDPLVLLGLGRRPGTPPEAGLVLDTGAGYAVLALDGLLDLVQLAEEDLLPVPAFAVPRPELLLGVADVGGQTCLVLDGEALLGEPQLRGLAAMNTEVGAADAVDDEARSRSGAAPGGAPYLTFSIGVDVTTPLEQVAEIVPWPASVTAGSAVPEVLGLTVHRGAAVPVLCLARLLGRPPLRVGPATCLLLLDVDGEPVAFAVDALRSIDPVSWTDPDQHRRTGAGDRLDRALQDAPLVQVGTSGKLLPELDLRRVARTVRGPVAVPAPRAPRDVAPVAAQGAPDGGVRRW